MGVKGASAYIRQVNYLLHGDILITLLFQKLAEGREDGLPASFLPSVAVLIFSKTELKCKKIVMGVLLAFCVLSIPVSFFHH